jgi:acyl carrier protein
MEEKVIEMLKDVLETDQVDINTSMENCSAWDSMNQLNISLEIEERWGITLEPSEIALLKSVKSTIELLKSKEYVHD